MTNFIITLERDDYYGPSEWRFMIRAESVVEACTKMVRHLLGLREHDKDMFQANFQFTSFKSLTSRRNYD